MARFFIPGVSDVSEDLLKEYFGQYGEVVKVSLSRGCAYLTMADEESRDELVTEKHELGGKLVRVLISKESLQGAEAKKVHIGRLDADISADALREAFSQFGTVLDVHTPKDPRTQVRKNYGFVTFSSDEAFDAALEQGSLDVDGRTVTIKPANQTLSPNETQQQWAAEEEAQNQRARKDNGIKYFVPGLPESVTDEALRSAFEQFGTVVDAAVVKEKGSEESRGFGYVTMEDEASQEAILTEPLRIEGKDIQVLLTKDSLAGFNVKKAWSWTSTRQRIRRRASARTLRLSPSRARRPLGRPCGPRCTPSATAKSRSSPPHRAGGSWMTTATTAAAATVAGSRAKAVAEATAAAAASAARATASALAAARATAAAARATPGAGEGLQKPSAKAAGVLVLAAAAAARAVAASTAPGAAAAAAARREPEAASTAAGAAATAGAAVARAVVDPGMATAAARVAAARALGRATAKAGTTRGTARAALAAGTEATARGALEASMIPTARAAASRDSAAEAARTGTRRCENEGGPTSASRRAEREAIAREVATTGAATIGTATTEAAAMRGADGTLTAKAPLMMAAPTARTEGVVTAAPTATARAAVTIGRASSAAARAAMTEAATIGAAKVATTEVDMTEAAARRAVSIEATKAGVASPTAEETATLPALGRRAAAVATATRGGREEGRTERPQRALGQAGRGLAAPRCSARFASFSPSLNWFH
eukprot:TRINITY_DN24015_c0_g1_i1.p1 TRINITY_DN24015_c0_g1~~TRINITY_DN24015_c0_g1_i1.p1  ORF type:complete len:719 (+),score=121.06 TRINITY_DN24015_c0_g1_i1:112-2268(+)